jgi:hypothetical protein
MPSTASSPSGSRSGASGSATAARIAAAAFAGSPGCVPSMPLIMSRVAPAVAA